MDRAYECKLQKTTHFSHSYGMLVKQIKDYIKNQLELVVDSPLKIKLYTSSEKRSTDRIEGYDVYLVQAKDGEMKYLVNWVKSKMPEHEFIITKFEKID